MPSIRTNTQAKNEKKSLAIRTMFVLWCELHTFFLSLLSLSTFLFRWMGGEKNEIANETKEKKATK